MFIERIDRYLTDDISAVLNIDNYSIIDISLFFDEEKLSRDNICLDDYNPRAIIRAIKKVAIYRQETWGQNTEDAMSLNLRSYLTLPQLDRGDMDFRYFNRLATMYRNYLKKERISGISYSERKDMDNIYNKMLALMLHFFSKTINAQLRASSAMVDRDDFDSTIALTLTKCLALKEKSLSQIVELVSDKEARDALDFYRSLTTQDLQTSISEFNLIRNKTEIVRGFIKRLGIIEAYVDTNGMPYYTEDDTARILSCIACEAKPARTSGFSSDKGNFGFYVTSAIKKEINKLFRLQLEVHYPAHSYIAAEDMENLSDVGPAPIDCDQDSSVNEHDAAIFEKQQSVDVAPMKDKKRIVPHRTIAILTPAESIARGISGAAVNKTEASISNAMNKAHGLYDREDTEVAEGYERQQLNKILCSTIKGMDNGDLVLYKFGIVYDGDTDEYYRTCPKTMKETAEEFGTKDYIVKYAIQKCGDLFREKYPDFLIEYFS